MKKSNWAVITPLANEEEDFAEFVNQVTTVFDSIGSGVIYLIVDKASRDRTLELCQLHSTKDPRFITVWAPENKNVVDAYLRGYKEALAGGHDYIIEMDAGLSHDPQLLKNFLHFLQEGYECVYGSRFVKGGSMGDSPFKRRMLSRTGTIASNLLLGTRLKDMTSGYQGFHARVVEQFLAYPLKSKAHFYQTELKYLLRKKRSKEIPINYKAPSPRVSKNAIRNSIDCLFYYFKNRLTNKPTAL